MTIESGAPSRAASQPSATQRKIVTFLLDHLVWFILAVVLVSFSLAIEHFFQVGIFINILRQATFVGILSVGLSLVWIAEKPDTLRGVARSIVRVIGAAAVGFWFVVLAYDWLTFSEVRGERW